MTRMDRTLIETAFVPRDTPQLSDCIARIAAAGDLSPARRRDLASGLTRLARALGRDPAQTPADPTWLRPRIARVAPAAIGLSPKTWSNIQSDARAALVHCGIVERRTRRLDDLSPRWQALWDRVRASGDASLGPALGRFVRFLDRTGVTPEAVTIAHAEAYRAAIACNELRRCPDSAMRQAIHGWNLAARRIAGWPGNRLTLPPAGNRYALPLDAFPAEFEHDLARFLDRLTRPDPLDPSALAAPLRPASIRHRRAQAIRFASALVAAGVAAEEITGLAALVVPENARRGLAWMLARNGGGSSPGIADTALLLKLLVRHHVRVPEEARRAIEDFAARLAVPPSRGLTARNRARLRALEDPAARHRLLCLPGTLAAAARAARPSRRACLDFEMAVVLLVYCPIRRRNLVELHLERNLRCMGDGRRFLVFEAGEVKNARPIEFELPPAVVALIDEHLRTRHSMLCPPGTPWLFPRRDGRAPAEPSGFSTRISATIRRQTGLDIHPHLFRHFAAKIVLEANPGAYEVVRRILGHAELSSTLNAYAGFEAGTATRLFSQLLETMRGGAE